MLWILGSVFALLLLRAGAVNGAGGSGSTGQAAPVQPGAPVPDLGTSLALANNNLLGSILNSLKPAGSSTKPATTTGTHSTSHSGPPYTTPIYANSVQVGATPTDPKRNEHASDEFGSATYQYQQNLLLVKDLTYDPSGGLGSGGPMQIEDDYLG